ncbi:uncharacterized protein LOC135805124 [Sycon ciliatum]|uniref:uncharacterized protein LOC135805124 n=1 Tax=Sycon ciliatum TaxID=27933 RepID=UPI0031F7169D
MGCDFLKVNSTTAVPVRILVRGAPSVHKPAPLKTPEKSEWFSDHHYQELLALLKTQLPNFSSLKQHPSGEFAGGDFVVNWRVQSWSIGHVTLLQKVLPHLDHPQARAEDVSCLSDRQSAGLKQSCLPWHQARDTTVHACADVKSAAAIAPARYEGLHFLPYLIHIIVSVKSPVLQVDQTSIPITAFFSSAVTSNGNQERQSPVDLSSIDHTVPVVSSEETSASIMQKSNCKDMLERPSTKKQQANVKSTVSNRLLKSYEKKSGGVSLSQDQARNIFQQTCAAFTCRSATSAAAAAKSPPSSILSSPTNSQHSQDGMEVTSPILASPLLQPKKKVDFERLYTDSPTVGEIEMQDERLGHSQMLASAKPSLCWVCEAGFVPDVNSRHQDRCNACLVSARPERRASVNDDAPVASPLSLLRRSSSSSSVLTPLSPLKRLSRTNSSASVEDYAPPAKQTRLEFAPSSTEDVDSTDARFRSRICYGGSHNPPRKATISELATGQMSSAKDAHSTGARFRSKIFYGSKCRRSLDLRASQEASFERTDTPTADTPARGSQSEDDDWEAVRSSCGKSPSHQSVLSASGRSWCANSIATSPISRPGSQTVSSSSAASHNVSKIRSRNARLGRIMDMDPQSATLDDVLMGSGHVVACASSHSTTMMAADKESPYFSTGGADCGGVSQKGLSPKPYDRSTAMETGLPYSPPEAASDGELGVSRGCLDLGAAVECKQTGSTLGSPIAKSPAVAGPYADSDSDVANDPAAAGGGGGDGAADGDDSSDSDCRVIASPVHQRTSAVRAKLRRSTSARSDVSSNTSSQPSSEQQSGTVSSKSMADRHPVVAQASVRSELTPKTRQRNRNRLKRPKKRANGEQTNGGTAAADEVWTASDACSQTTDYSEPVDVDEQSKGLSTDAAATTTAVPSPRPGDGACEQAEDSNVSDDEADRRIVNISDDSACSDGEEIDAATVVATLEYVTPRQLKRYVVQFRPQLKDIFSGKRYNERHEKYKEGGKAGKQVARQHSMVSSAHQEVVARVLLAMFCRGEDVKFYDYTMLVLLPECLVMLVTKLCNCSEDVARAKLIT